MLVDKDIQNYFDLWGFKNYGTTRLLSKEQVSNFLEINETNDAPLYLEITHHPRIKPTNLIKDQYGRVRPGLSYSKSLIPLTKNHLKSIMNSMNTSRFIVSHGKAYRYGSRPSAFSIDLPNVESGIYEFDNGVLYKVQLDSIFLKAPQFVKDIFNILPFGGYLIKAPKNHPLYDLSEENVQLLYNIGIEWHQHFLPKVKNQYLTPSRYAYFRDNELYLLGKPIFKENDLTLQKFIENEELLATSVNSYEPFIDSGPPLLENNELDVQKIMENGLKIPEKSYLAMGDNHANSSDSRDFGFVPQDNIKGSANFIFWPPNRWGKTLQPSFPPISFPKVFVWVIFSGVMVVIVIVYKKRKLY